MGVHPSLDSKAGPEAGPVQSSVLCGHVSRCGAGDHGRYLGAIWGGGGPTYKKGTHENWVLLTLTDRWLDVLVEDGAWVIWRGFIPQSEKLNTFVGLDISS